MGNKKIVIGVLIVLFVYMLLSVINSLYWMDGFRDNGIVAAIGPITDGDLLDLVWLPGQFFSFLIGIALDTDFPILGGLITYGIYSFLILLVSGISMKELFNPAESKNGSK